MELNEILTAIKGTQRNGMQKTAGASSAKASAPKTAQAQAQLSQALKTALTPPQQTKTAADNSSNSNSSNTAAPAIDTLTKVASALANSDQEALIKEAQLYGAAVADGFMARIGQYEQAVMALPAQTKTAAAGVPTDAEFEKFAAENPELVKQAMEVGYRDGQQQIEMLKQAVFTQGYNDARAQIAGTKTAAARNDLSAQLEKLAETPEGREKLAAIKQGYDDTMTELTKMASETFDRGYQDTITILKAM